MYGRSTIQSGSQFRLDFIVSTDESNHQSVWAIQEENSQVEARSALADRRLQLSDAQSRMLVRPPKCIH